MKKNLTIGLVGFGFVGQGLYDIISKNSNLGIHIKQICVKDKQKKRSLPAHFFTYNYEDLLLDPEISVVVELIDDSEEAFRIVKSSLRKQKAVVTANKKMIAEHLEELLELQRIYHTPLLYEASTCGGIPIIRTLEEYYNNEHLQSVSGIFNGSSNYILTQIFQHGKTYARALTEAQNLGFAESNPVLDVDGFDTKFKLIILTAHAFGVIIKPSDVFNIGISSLLPEDLNWIRQSGLSIKLEARSEIVKGNQLRLSVLPVLVSDDSALGRVAYEFNTVLVKAAFSDQQQFTGKGAGGHPTGSAVLSDIAALQYGYRYEYHKLRTVSNSLKFSNQHPIRVVIRTTDAATLQNFHNAQFSVSNLANGYVVAIGTVTLQELIRNQTQLMYSQSLVAELDDSSEELIRKTLHRRFAVQRLSSLVNAC